jgi:tetratricopeptide (TPR) repeat protein
MTGPREPNLVLKARMRAAGMTAADLAERMNVVLLAKTGRKGEYCDRTIRRLLSGQTRWPQSRSRLALETVFGSTAVQLGFHDPTSKRHREDPVQRRQFLTGSAVAAVGPLVPAKSAGQVGTRDVEELRTAHDSLIANDDRNGGSRSLEIAALSQGQRAIDLLQNGWAGSGTRRRVYALASEAITTAGWAATDSGEHGRAQHHLERALALAGLSGDGSAVVRAWNHLAMLSQNRKRYADAAAAADAARSSGAARRDPVYASLAFARAAVAHGAAGDDRRALRALGQAQDALSRSQPGERPAWIFFYDAAELDGLSAVTHLRLGRSSDAEYYAHRTLARLKPGLDRNRAFYTTVLGLAQVGQGDLEQACATVDPLFTTDVPGSQRVRGRLKEFRAKVVETGSAHARQWLTDTPIAI